ncbi:anaerobic NTP reductase large subunit [Pseudomonas phage JHP]|uniref:Uncharacterized protein n=3 Tax=Pakpunavirus TaxID=1921407 RepID=A0AAF0DP14_9CAUD|nr:hypothetical protein QE322_gp092 [Pseudomonas phage PaGz-1]YP_010762255.1 hypothetical protein QE323_gp047 [Pseudomonas phage SPA05]YP_010762401.1 anaerobic NTP reductase large subunit [Pseudomonas phage ITTPL]QBJ04655.1 anaerobic NTP reductase large subunit [Pseudomonas phage JHP]WIC39257.1 hypothetical protein vFB297_0500 [Pseudomonas phage vFB297]QBP28116.1 anaerobic NTP reductase large subunit [Pseudomonas phage ITTPL]QJC44168.1 hypothetical protein [Pseudomonas phage PaGz-1]WEY17916.
MARQTYESASDRAVEEAVRSELENRWKCSLHKLPRAHYMDWAACRNGKVVSFVELKARNNEMQKYPDFFVSQMKWLHGIEMQRVFDIPAFLVVKWTDYTGYVKMTANGINYMSMGGRIDRGDWQDQEVMVHIPLKDFTRL